MGRETVGSSEESDEATKRRSDEGGGSRGMLSNRDSFSSFSFSTCHSASRRDRPIEPKASASASRRIEATGRHARLWNAEIVGNPPPSRRHFTIRLAWSFRIPFTCRNPSLTAGPPTPQVALSSSLRRSVAPSLRRFPSSNVQSHSLALTSTGRTSTPWSRASRTSWAGA